MAVAASFADQAVKERLKTRLLQMYALANSV
jgi:hypothetical protein